MTQLIAIDGPRGSNSVAVAKRVVDRLTLLGFDVKARWNIYDYEMNDATYLNYVMEDMWDTPDFCVWEGTWVKNHVWGKIKYGGRLAENPELGEWFYGRWFSYKAIVLGPGGNRQEKQISVTDMDREVSSTIERNMFKGYGRMNGWDTIENDYDDSDTALIAKEIVERAVKSQIPKYFFGDAEPNTIVMEGYPSLRSDFPMPFVSSPKHYALMTMLPEQRIMWVVATKAANLNHINDFSCTIVCIDEESERLARLVCDDPSRILRISVPPIVPPMEYLKVIAEFWENIKEDANIKSLVDEVNKLDLDDDDDNDDDEPEVADEGEQV